MNVLIIEDEPLGATALKAMLHRVDASIQVMGITDGIHSSVQWLQAYPAPDLIFMDIELADGQSFAIFEEVVINSPVIFTTSFDEYALQAFKANGVDYLLKPVSEEDLRKSLEKVYKLGIRSAAQPTIYKELQQVMNQFNKTLPSFKERFLVRVGQHLLSIGLDEVAYFFTKGKVSFIKTKQGKEHFLDYSLDELEPMLPPQQFFRINRQYILPHAAVQQITPAENGKLKVQVVPPAREEIIISRDRAKSFRHWMGA